MVRGISRPAQQFIFTEGASGRLLLVAAIVALVWANSPFSDDYDALWGHVVSIDLGFVELTEDVKHWVNDGLMTLFFFLVTLEVKRERDVFGGAEQTLPLARALKQRFDPQGVLNPGRFQGRL